MKNLLLISNRVMHYRVSVYNYFHRRFREHGYELYVRADVLQGENENDIEFDFSEIPFRFSAYRKEIIKLRPKAVILFLHLKDPITLPLVHWLKIKGIPVIYWTHGMNLSNPGSRISRILHSYMHTVADRILLYSESGKEHVSSSHSKKVFVANNTLNFEDFPPIKESREELKARLNIPFRRVALAVGRMEVGGGRKKINHLVHAFKEINDDGFGLLIIGSGVDEDNRQGSGEGNILYMGPIHDPLTVNRIFKLADLFCLPGFLGLGLNQAFYWGLPVVTEEGIHPPEYDYLQDGRNGYVVPENDVQALKNRILELLRNDELREQMSRYAREDIQTHASIEGMFMGFKRCIDSVVTD